MLNEYFSLLSKLTYISIIWNF